VPRRSNAPKKSCFLASRGTHKMNNERNVQEVKELLKQVIPPVHDTELRRDLWPQMLRKLDEHSAPVFTVPWFDWALAAVLGVALVFFPGAIPALLYHL